MAVLNTTSPTDRPGAPTETPSKIVPSSSARMAGRVTGFALMGEWPLAAENRRLQQSTDSGCFRSGLAVGGRAGIVLASVRITNDFFALSPVPDPAGPSERREGS